MEDYSDEILYREYMNKMAKVREQIEQVNKNQEMLLMETENFNHVDNNIAYILEDIYMCNREDETFMREMNALVEELHEVKFNIDTDIQNMYEKYVDESRELLLQEESIEMEYRRWMEQLDFEEVNEDVDDGESV